MVRGKIGRIRRDVVETSALVLLFLCLGVVTDCSRTDRGVSLNRLDETSLVGASGKPSVSVSPDCRWIVYWEWEKPREEF